MEQVLYQLPDGWKWKTLSETTLNAKADIVDGPFGSNLKASEYVSKGVPILRLQNVDRLNFINKNIQFITEKKAELLSRHSYKVGDIVITKLGAPLGKACIVPNDFEDGRIVADIVRARINESEFDKKYICYAINSSICVRQLESQTKGATRPRVNLSHMRGLILPIAPIAEQKRIVEKLDALLTRIDTAIEYLQESVTLADALAQNGVDVYFAELSKANIEFPLSKLVEFISGYAFKSGDFSVETGVKPIKITNVGVKEFSESEDEFLPVSYQQKFDKFSVKENDIVIALTRPIINGGVKVCRVPESYSGALVNQRVAAITSENVHLLDFIYLYLQSTRTKNYVLEKSKSLNQPNLSITDLKNLTLPIPTDDKAIAKAISDCNALITKARSTKAVVLEKIVLLNQLKESILDSAFKGEL